MESKQYEKFVADVLKGLSISKNARIYRNRKYAGIRQPGSYEIDIACEVWLDEALFFLIIVECKDWSRPIDRPQIQKLIQTRDAISAHKCAFASPLGYTKEAIDVAKANGVALWVVANGTFNIVLAAGGGAAMSTLHYIASDFKRLICNTIDYQEDFLTRVKNNERTVIPIEWLRDWQYENFPTFSGDEILRYFISDFYEDNLLDPILQLFIHHIFYTSSDTNSLSSAIQSRISLYHSILIESGMNSLISQEYIYEFIKGLLTYDSNFYRTFDFIEASLDFERMKLKAPSEWVTKRGFNDLLGISPDNIFWVNVRWYMEENGIKIHLWDN